MACYVLLDRDPACNGRKFAVTTYDPIVARAHQRRGGEILSPEEFQGLDPRPPLLL